MLYSGVELQLFLIFKVKDRQFDKIGSLELVLREYRSQKKPKTQWQPITFKKDLPTLGKTLETRFFCGFLKDQGRIIQPDKNIKTNIWCQSFKKNAVKLWYGIVVLKHPHTVSTGCIEPFIPTKRWIDEVIKTYICLLLMLETGQILLLDSVFPKVSSIRNIFHHLKSSLNHCVWQ